MAGAGPAGRGDRGAGSPRRLPELWGGPVWRGLSAEGAGAAGGDRSGPTSEPVLRPRGLSQAGHAAIGPFPLRKVYVAPVVVIAAVLRTGPTRASVRRVRDLFGVSRRTLGRWLRWWRTTFVKSQLYQAARGRFVPPVLEESLPSSLLWRFEPADDPWGRLRNFLRFLGPLTTRSAAFLPAG